MLLTAYIFLHEGAIVLLNLLFQHCIYNNWVIRNDEKFKMIIHLYRDFSATSIIIAHAQIFKAPKYSKTHSNTIQNKNKFQYSAIICFGVQRNSVQHALLTIPFFYIDKFYWFFSGNILLWYWSRTSNFDFLPSFCLFLRSQDSWSNPSFRHT